MPSNQAMNDTGFGLLGEEASNRARPDLIFNIYPRCFMLFSWVVCAWPRERKERNGIFSRENAQKSQNGKGPRVGNLENPARRTR